MQNTKKLLLIIFSIVLVGCLIYIPGVNGLGLYRDAWNYLYNLTVRGPETLIKAFGADRPADGYLIAALFHLFGTNVKAYLIWNLCCRILSSVFFALTIYRVWPRHPKMAGLAGILAVVFPGFLQQVDAYTYVPHQTAMLCFMLSLYLTVLVFGMEKKVLQIILVLFSIVLSFINVILMEYYIGMEIYRFVFICIMYRKRSDNKSGMSFLRCLLAYLPYLLPAIGFVIWRVFFFKAERAGTDAMAEIITPFLTHPAHELGDLAVRTLKSVWKLFAGVWTIPAYTLLNKIEMKAFIRVLIPAAAITAAGCFVLFLMYWKKKEESLPDTDSVNSELICFGLLCGSIAILPLIISGRDINFNSSLDRFSWPGMIGSVLFLLGLLGSLRRSVLRNALITAVMLLSVFLQWQNQKNYIDSWNNTQEYWQQLIWRAPSLQKGTTIVTDGSLLAEEDYEIFCPASMIYYPEEKEWAPVSAEILSEDTVRDIRMGEKTLRNVREIYTEKDYQQLIAITKPNGKSCLRIINGENPIYSLRDYSKVPSIGSYSKPEQIILDPETETAYPFFLEKEMEHGWCYYYEKMELALQRKEYETAAGLADEALDKHLAADDIVEWIPLIEAYVETGRSAEAVPYAEKLLRYDYMVHMALNYFNNKDNSELYSDVITLLEEELSKTDE